VFESSLQYIVSQIVVVLSIKMTKSIGEGYQRLKDFEKLSSVDVVKGAKPNFIEYIIQFNSLYFDDMN